MKRIRRQVRKTSDQIVISFLKSMEHEKLLTRLRVAWSLITNKFRDP